MNEGSARLVLVNLGTPAHPTPAAVREFLEEFLSDPDVIDFPAWLWKPILRGLVLRRRPQRVAELYRSIWTDGGSPLEAGTRRIARGVAELLPEGLEGRWAYRYGEPSLEKQIREARNERVVVLPLYAQPTSSTTKTVFDEARRAAATHDLEGRLCRAELAPDDAGYIEASVDRCRQAMSSVGWDPEHLLISFHGIPTRYDRREDGRYSGDCRRTYAAILEALDWAEERATLCYQSKFGPEPWLRPATADLLAELPRRGVRRLAIMTPGFLTEGLETLEEIGIQGRETFLQAGGQDYLRVPTPEDHPALLESLARLGAEAGGFETTRQRRDDARPVAREVTAGLLARYDRPGPRYTSYPTAVEFAEDVDEKLYGDLLARADEAADEPLSVYVHLPFCEHRCLFCGCHVIATTHYDRTLPYLGWLEKEIDAVAERLSRRRRLSQLHLGGGTPTYYRPDDLDDLLDLLLDRFEVTPDAELAVEVDPRVTDREHLEVLAAHGFNRISLGVQDFDRRVQEAIERIQSREHTEVLVDAARDLGFEGINIDLIYGLPHQGPGSFEKTVAAVVEMGADRSAVYSFAYVPWIRGHQKSLDEEAIPGRETKFELFATARERFLEAGYEPVGMDHFALPHDELAVARREHRLRRNFQGYTVLPASDSLGLGISAIGDVRGAYVQNVKKLSAYRERLAAGELPVERGVVRSADDELRRDVIHELMCNFRVDVEAIEARHGVDFHDTFAPDLEALAAHEREGLVRIGERAVEATPAGELFVRNLAMCFDRYSRERHGDGGEKIFSRTV